LEIVHRAAPCRNVPVTFTLYGMTVVATIREAWGWCGIEPAEVVGENAFGNLMVRDTSGRYWRLCPEACSCEVVAEDKQQLDALVKDQIFLANWYMKNLSTLGETKFGPLALGRKFCLRIPAVLGGEYASENLETMAIEELIASSGHIARQIKDLPDGASVRLKVT
jgi:hypothetical protein